MCDKDWFLMTDNVDINVVPFHKATDSGCLCPPYVWLKNNEKIRTISIHKWGICIIIPGLVDSQLWGHVIVRISVNSRSESQTPIGC